MLIRRADFAADHAAIRQVRFAVFVDEQNVPADIEIDDRDPHCVHVLAFDDESRPVGTGRIDLESSGKIGRVAVLDSARRRGIGTGLMDLLQRIAQQRHLAAVWCNAQVSALPFYAQLGYHVTSGRFYEAGIEHVRMEREL